MWQKQRSFLLFGFFIWIFVGGLALENLPVNNEYGNFQVFIVKSLLYILGLIIPTGIYYLIVKAQPRRKH